MNIYPASIPPAVRVELPNSSSVSVQTDNSPQSGVNPPTSELNPDEEITGASRLKQDCGLTSFDTTCVVGELCELYGVEPSALDLRAVKTVAELHAALEAAKAGA